MLANHSFARQVRLGRLHRHGQGLFVVPMDHSVTNGPLRRGRRLDHLVGQLAGRGVDAIVLHKGSARQVSHRWFRNLSLIVHLSASTRHAADPDEKYLVTSVDESLRLGADAVSVHVNLGSLDERRQITDLATVAEACDRWNLPLLAMMYPRGPKIDNPRDPDLVAHAATLAADLGADIVKTPYVGSVPEMRDVVRSCPIPLVVAGGSRLDQTGELLAYVSDALDAGVAGLAMGRNVFQAHDPGAVAQRIAELVHREPEAAPVRSLEELDVATG